MSITCTARSPLKIISNGRLISEKKYLIRTWTIS